MAGPFNDGILSDEQCLKLSVSVTQLLSAILVITTAPMGDDKNEMRLLKH